MEDDKYVFPRAPPHSLLHWRVCWSPSWWGRWAAPVRRRSPPAETRSPPSPSGDWSRGTWAAFPCRSSYLSAYSDQQPAENTPREMNTCSARTHTHSFSHTHTHIRTRARRERWTPAALPHTQRHKHTHTHTQREWNRDTHRHTHSLTLSLSHTHTHTHSLSLSLTHTHSFKTNQITFSVTSPQHKCLGEWNSYERAPEKSRFFPVQKKQNNNLHMDSTYLQYIFLSHTHTHSLSLSHTLSLSQIQISFISMTA